MKEFERFLSEGNIQYRAVKESSSLKAAAIKLRAAYRKEFLLSKEFLLLYFLVIIETLISINGLINFNDDAFYIAFSTSELVFCIFCLVFTIVLVISKTKKLYCQRSCYYVKCNKENMIREYMKSIAQNLYSREKDKYLDSKVYELIVKNKKQVICISRENTEKAVYIIIFERQLLHKCPILLIPENLLSEDKQKNKNMESFLRLLKLRKLDFNNVKNYANDEDRNG